MTNSQQPQPFVPVPASQVEELQRLQERVASTQLATSAAGLAMVDAAGASWDAGCAGYDKFMKCQSDNSAAVNALRDAQKRLAALQNGGSSSPATPATTTPTSSTTPAPGGQQSPSPTSPAAPATPSSNSPQTPAPAAPARGGVSNITTYEPQVVTKYGGGDVTVSFDNTKNVWRATWKRPDMEEPYVVFESNPGRRLTAADFKEGTLGRRNLDAAVVRYRREKGEVSGVPRGEGGSNLVVAGQDGLNVTPDALEGRKYVGTRDGRQVLVGRLKGSKHWFTLTPDEDGGYNYYQLGEKRPEDDAIRKKIEGGGFTYAWDSKGKRISGKVPAPGSGVVGNIPPEEAHVVRAGDDRVQHTPDSLVEGTRRYVGTGTKTGEPKAMVMVGQIRGSNEWVVMTPKEGGGYSTYKLSGAPNDERIRAQIRAGSFSSVFDTGGKRVGNPFSKASRAPALDDPVNIA